MIGRNSNRQVVRNATTQYKKSFERRGRTFINQYILAKLTYPTVEQIRRLTRVGHIWSTGDTMSKLAHKFYGDMRLWWIIAFFNKKPTDAHIELGQTIIIPTPKEEILKILKVR